MADYNYTISISFPLGLNLLRLRRVLRQTWPANLRDFTLTVLNGTLSQANVYGSGDLTISTSSNLTAQQQSDAEATFSTMSIVSPSGFIVEDPPDGPARGDSVYFSDAPRLGGGNGTMCYFDGSVWRFFNDDNIYL